MLNVLRKEVYSSQRISKYREPESIVCYVRIICKSNLAEINFNKEAKTATAAAAKKKLFARNRNSALKTFCVVIRYVKCIVDVRRT